jgi:ketosteroid isomerase-like protein
VAGTESQDEIRKVIDEGIQALNAGDAVRLRTMLSLRPDAVHIGTAAEEWETSEQVLDAIALEGGNDIQLVVDDIGIHVQGDIAWSEGHGRFTRADGAERPVRITYVFIREDGRWKLVQSHGSIGVPDAETFG